MASLEAILTDNGLGKWFATLAAEEVDLDTIADLTIDELEKIGLPLGARKKIVKLFGSKPLRPDAPVSSKDSSPNKHSGRVLHVAGGIVVEWAKRGSGKKFACFLSHHKASCAMEARYLKTELQGLIQKECFLDSDDLRVSGSAAAGVTLAMLLLLRERTNQLLICSLARVSGRICESLSSPCTTATCL